MVNVKYGRSEAYIKLGPLNPPMPLVAVRIQGGGRYFDTRGLIDSGADVTSFNAELLVPLGLNWDNGRLGNIRGVTGAPEEARIFDLRLTVCGHAFISSVQFTKSHIREFGLLGRADFFRAFRVGFDQRSEVTLLHPLAP
jgi:hypothetical protein